MDCPRNTCFYCVHGRCVSLSVLSVETCENYLSRKATRHHPTPSPLQMADLRRGIDRNAPPVTVKPQGIALYH